MGYAGYAPGHKVVEKTPLQAKLAAIKSTASFDIMEKLTRNVAQAPAEEKFRQIRLSNEKIKAVLIDVAGALDAMIEMGWVHEGEFLKLPEGSKLSMAEVREIDEARRQFAKEEEEALKRRALKRTITPERMTG